MNGDFAPPIVFRAGKLPKGLPSWFDELDTNKDGQVALHEWRKGGRGLDEFAEIDRNDDGFITIEEALRYVAQPKNPFAERGKKIDAIIYSNLSKDQMLEKLKPYVAVMDTNAAIEKKTGLILHEGKHTGRASKYYTI